MIFGPQRGSVFTIFDKFAGTFGLPVLVVLLALLFRNMDALLENGIVLAIVLVNPFLRLYRYLFTWYAVDGEKFHVKSGWFNKRDLEIPLDRITTVDFTQNLIFQWAGVYSIKVDNASNYGGNGAGKVELALKEKDAVRLKTLLLSENKETSQPQKNHAGVVKDLAAASSAASVRNTAIVVPARNILLMGALQSKGNAVAQVISMLTVLGGMGNIIVGSELGLEDELMELVLSIPGIGIAAIVLAAFVLLSTVLGAVFTLIRYYGFRITESGNSLLLQYGLLTRKSHSLLKEKISGVEYVQSLPMRLFRVGYLNVLAVGYGDLDTQEKALLYPLISQEQMADFVARHVPGMEKAEAAYEKPPGRSIGYFFLCPRVFLSLALTAGVVILDRILRLAERCPVDVSWIWGLLALILLAVCLSVAMEFRNTAVAAGAQNVHLVTGGLTRIRTVIRTEMIESVSDRATVLKRRKGIVTIRLGILAPAFDSVKQVRNMHCRALEHIKAVIHY